MKSLSTIFENAFPVYEGIFDDQDETVSIKSPRAPIWSLISMNDCWKPKINYRNTSYEGGVLDIGLDGDIVCNFAERGAIERTYPDFKCITSTSKSIDWNGGDPEYSGSRPFSIFDEHVIGSPIVCGSFHVKANVVKNIDISASGKSFNFTKYGVGFEHCEEMDGVNIEVHDPYCSEVIFNCDEIPVFKNCELKLDRMHFYSPQLLHKSADVFAKLFDFSRPAKFILPNGDEAKSPSNFKKLIAYLRNPKKYAAYWINTAYCINPYTTLKELGLDIGYLPDRIRFRENGLEMYMVNYKNPLALHRFAPSGKITDVLPPIKDEVGLDKEIAQLMKYPELKTKEGYLVFFKKS